MCTVSNEKKRRLKPAMRDHIGTLFSAQYLKSDSEDFPSYDDTFFFSLLPISEVLIASGAVIIPSAKMRRRQCEVL